MELARGRADLLGQPALDEAVDVLVARGGKCRGGIGCDLVAQRLKPGDNLVTLACRQQSRRAIACAQAMEPVMSASHSRQSNGSDALKRAMSGSVWPVKRPPQSGVIGFLNTTFNVVHRVLHSGEPIPTR